MLTLTRRLLTPMVLLLTLALVLAACGGDDDDDSAGEPTATANVATPAATQPAATPTTAGSAPTATAPAGATTPATPTSQPPATQPPSSPTGSATAETLTLSVYFMRDEKIGAAHRVVPHTLQVAAASMAELLAGPTAAESEAGLSSAIPEDTEYIETTIEDGIATVNLSSEFESGGGSLSMSARLAQVVYTLTQFPSVEGVQFALDGEIVEAFGGEGIVIDEPLTRADFEDLTPAIFVESPTVGDAVDSPLRIWGTANTFEAVFNIRLEGPDGETLYEDFAMATSGTGTRGTFDVEIEFDAPATGEGTLVVYESSAKDGSPINVVEIPVVFGE